MAGPLEPARFISSAAFSGVGDPGQGAVAHAYAPVYAVDLPFAATHPDLLMYRNDGSPERLFDNIQLANPANVEWQRHFARAYGSAADAIGFNGFHIDTYGFPRAAYDHHGTDIDMRLAYESFLTSFRSERPRDLVSFNQVNGVPSALELAPGPRFRYCEVWPPNSGWRHLEALMDRSAGVVSHVGRLPKGDLMRGTIACYPPVWGKGERQAALRTVVLTEAVATSLGASALIYGDRTAALCDPYYPKHETLTSDEAATVISWHRFALRCRDLFLEGEDTSWYEVADENGAVALDWEGPVRPEPVGGALFARVVRADDSVAVGVVDLSGSGHGLWSEPTEAGTCRSVRVARPLAWPRALGGIRRRPRDGRGPVHAHAFHCRRTPRRPGCPGRAAHPFRLVGAPAARPQPAGRTAIGPGNGGPYHGHGGTRPSTLGTLRLWRTNPTTKATLA